MVPLFQFEVMQFLQSYYQILIIIELSNKYTNSKLTWAYP